MIVRGDEVTTEVTLTRALARYLRPELTRFSETLLRGESAIEATVKEVAEKLSSVEAYAAAHGVPRLTSSLPKMIPVRAGGRFPRLERDVVEAILALRSQGKSRRQIAKATKRPVTTIHHVLRREGDPAPADVVERDLERKKATIAKLQKQLDEQMRKQGEKQ